MALMFMLLLLLLLMLMLLLVLLLLLTVMLLLLLLLATMMLVLLLTLVSCLRSTRPPATTPRAKRFAGIGVPVVAEAGGGLVGEPPEQRLPRAGDAIAHRVHGRGGRHCAERGMENHFCDYGGVVLVMVVVVVVVATMMVTS